ncbi:YbaB/EbfC family nucleoid-associated protein [Acanthopleuribacter pedis]|uniref:Nucleoid-associated protein J3U88_15955 n=1 Tax=Acanthopleuribacter pedis TaxID=442870 RepID=A0A8J7U337_9BACT|nr:YbaB/EbfC family nucleoid-associated protein [Acanthopleuribacter pedis]MBO1319968.1 YbaB/EbfC family nucleoid-associated protein [Acanthopleuribacter pedis]
MFDMNQIQQMMGQAQQAQQEIKDRLAKMAIHGHAAGEMVKVTINGNKEVTKIEFAPNAPDDKEYLADLVLVALSDAYAQADERIKGQMGNMLGNIDLSQIANLFRK